MFKKILLGIAACLLTCAQAFAAVDVNKGDQAALDGVKGLGPAKTKAILEERKKNGEFKDWADFEKRVKGIGEKSAAKLSEAGLTVNGVARPSAEAAAKGDAKAEAKKDLKAEAKAAVTAAAASANAISNKKK